MANFKAVVRGERKDGFMQVYIHVTHRRVHGYMENPGSDDPFGQGRFAPWKYFIFDSP